MGQTIFLEHYRVVLGEDEKPRELTRTGEAVTYRAIDLRSAETVALTQLPVSAIPPDLRAGFETRARATAALDHPNIAKLLAFGTEDDDFVLVSEFLQGETIGRWVALRGPLPADAALRTALQVTNALSAAGFQGLNHPAIQPSNIIIVPGQATEGGWPYVKVTNFALAGIKLEAMPQFASPEQLKGSTVDFRSEVYSIGATMWFMLTGAIPGAQDRIAETRLLRKLPRNVRGILAHTLQPDSAQRPGAPMEFTEEILDALGKVDRRQALGKKFGIPVAVPMTTAPTTEKRWKVPAAPLAIAAVLLTLLALGAVFRPDRLLHQKNNVETVGVPVGVSDVGSPGKPTPADAAPGNVAAVQEPATAAPPVAMTTNSPAQSNPAEGTQHSDVAAAPVAIPQPSNAPEVVSSPQVPAVPLPEVRNSTPPAESNIAAAQQPPPGDSDNSNRPKADEVQPEPVSKSSPPAKTIASRKSEDEPNAKTAATRQSAKVDRKSDDSGDGLPPLSVGSMRAKFVGTTPDGKWILALPNSETVTVPPPPIGKRTKKAPQRLVPRALPVEEEPVTGEQVVPAGD